MDAAVAHDGGPAADAGPASDAGPEPVTGPWEVNRRQPMVSSPRAFHVNDDGILDVVIGRGSEFDENGGVDAFSGGDGQLLWSVDGDQEMVGTASPAELDGDEGQELVIGGRNGELHGIDVATGERLWRWSPFGQDGKDAGWYNFYTCQSLGDLDGDLVDELLCANGGDSAIDPFQARPPGHLTVLSGADGSVYRSAVMPDGAETYMSPVVFRRRDGTQVVVFGSGGETLAGSLWWIPMTEFLEAGLAAAEELMAPANFRGAIAPPSLADLNGDGTLDVIVAFFDGQFAAFDGETGAELWRFDELGTETQASPAVCHFNADGEADVFASFAQGVFPNWRGTVLKAVSADGQLLHREILEDLVIIATPLCADLDGDGLDEVFLSANTGQDLEAGFGGPMPHFLLIMNPVDWSITTWLEQEGMTFSTPLIADLDADGQLELISARYQRRAGWRLARRDLQAVVPERLSWPGYLGPLLNGRAHP
ncbi:MAG: hypothetical protein CMH55_03000 [Myxococcales bacterium]|nr:hypothetical protein [Myxococcales bacterium]